MKIERIDEKTVRCFLSNEELEEYEIDYKDFVLRSEKAKEIVQEIIMQAEEEVGYKPPKYAFDLQIMMVPDQGLLLTFSDKDPDFKEGSQIMECLKEMKKILQKTKEQVENSSPKPEAEPTGGKPRASEKDNRPDYAVFVFSGMHNVMNYAAALPGNLRVESELYGQEGIYYLYIRKSHASYERFSRACIQALEFGSLYAADESSLLLIKEHEPCLIAEKALKKLRG
ncbi:MAG: adaptor protein MecA [Acetatifactor sp.]